MTNCLRRWIPRHAPGSWGGGTEVLLSDTVGFVRDLPHNLVASSRPRLKKP